MTRILWVFSLAVCLLGPAQLGAQTKSVQNPAVREFQNLISDPKRGFIASQQLLNNSFAAHLHQSETPLSLSDLDQLGASYDPHSDTPLAAGMLYFHLAHPVHLLRQKDTGGDEILARVIEARIRWLAGDTVAARLQIENLIVQFADIGGTDDQMVSMLADAAILAWRDGEPDVAQGFLSRARVCPEPRCPTDFIFDWLGPNRKAAKAPFDAYDPDIMRRAALRDAPILFANSAPILAEIEQEALFATGDWVRDLALATPDKRTFSGAERKQIRLMADRLLGRNNMVAYLMRSASVASEFADLQSADGVLSAEKLADGNVAYVEDARWSGFIMEQWPLFHRLYLLSDRPGDVIVARTIEARLVLSAGEPLRALDLLSSIVDDARAQGFSDAQLHAVLLDQWAAAVLAKMPDIAAEAAAATAPCRQTSCDQDLVDRLASRYLALPSAVYPGSLTGTIQASADHFIRWVFPGDFLKLANLYRTGSLAAEKRPMDAARDDILAFEFAEQVPDLPIADLGARAAWAIEVLVHAGQYRQAVEIADRTANRAKTAGQEDSLSTAFYQRRARAGFRMNDPRAQDFYDIAVDKTLIESASSGRADFAMDLILDLLDTGYDASLLRLIEGRPELSDVRARVYFRQGRTDLAAGEYRAFRHRQELPFLTVGGRADHPAVYAQNPHLRAMALQEAHYRSALGEAQETQRLVRLAGAPDWPRKWPDLDTPMAADQLARFTEETSGFGSSMSLIRPMFEFRDTGNYQGAAAWMRDMAWVAQGAEQSGSYLDAQTLWQMAFTFARAGETAIAFDLMDRAAKIAATLSFEGAGDGMLQLLERDRWRYLLFVDIAWGAVTGQVPEQMLVVSRY